MRRKRNGLLGGSILPFVRFRLIFGSDDAPGLGSGGGSSTPVSDIEPTNGGPERTFDDLGSGLVEEPTPTPVVSQTPAASQPPAPTPADPNNAAGVPVSAPPAPATSAEQWQSIRDAATSFGYQFDQTITDDRAALIHLLKQAQANRSSDAYAQLGRQLAPQATQIQQYLQQQKAPATPTTRPAWEAPEFDQRWSGLVEQDPTTGLYVSKQGVPHEIATKVNSYVEWKSNYDRNPAAVMNQMVEAKATEIANKAIDARFASHQRENAVSDIVNRNSSWVYQTDQAGQRAVNPVTGQYQPTPAGARYMYHIAALQRAGVTDPRSQDTLAKSLVSGEYASAYQQHHSQQSALNANPMTQQSINQPNINPIGSQPITQQLNNNAAPETSAIGKSLAQMYREEFAREGITDADFSIRD